MRRLWCARCLESHSQLFGDYKRRREEEARSVPAGLGVEVRIGRDVYAGSEGSVGEDRVIERVLLAGELVQVLGCGATEIRKERVREKQVGDLGEIACRERFAT